MDYKHLTSLPDRDNARVGMDWYFCAPGAEGAFLFLEVSSVTIVFNGQEIALRDGTTILEFVKQQGLKPNSIVVEHNYEIVKEAQWDSVVLKAKDTLEALNFVGGG